MLTPLFWNAPTDTTPEAVAQDAGLLAFSRSSDDRGRKFKDAVIAAALKAGRSRASIAAYQYTIGDHVKKSHALSHTFNDGRAGQTTTGTRADFRDSFWLCKPDGTLYKTYETVNGKRILKGYRPDVGSPDYLRYSEDRVRLFASTGGWDGLAWDNAESGLGKYGGKANDYQNQPYTVERWQQMLRAYYARMKAVAQAVNPAYRFFGNLIEPERSQGAAAWDHLLDSFDGGMIEAWMVGWPRSDAQAEDTESAAWQAVQMDVADRWLRRGKSFVCVVQLTGSDPNSATNARRRMHGYAAYWMIVPADAPDRAQIRATRSTQYERTLRFPEHAIDPGAPLADREPTSKTAWRRRFERGVWAVDLAARVGTWTPAPTPQPVPELPPPTVEQRLATLEQQHADALRTIQQQADALAAQGQRLAAVEKRRYTITEVAE